MSAVRPILEASGLDIALFGMVKDDKHRTRAIAEDGGEIAINFQSQGVYPGILYSGGGPPFLQLGIIARHERKIL